ncbi:hypothetical protein ACRALDRAFT_1061371 [Sodiomyces alcalophilus JCM 7366]|uniref:uncharacterized protein n=1 Tax=Sodiomyces alcalophilus JCM 7366 TaxID=591952 RepID=UPI0039B649B1
MKFLYPITLLAGALAVSAQSNQCDALHIVEACLEGQNQRFTACANDDWDCKCHAAEAIATCYNNCPSDPRASSARGQVTIHCQNASIHGTAARAAATSTGSVADATDSAAATATPTSSSDDDDEDDDEDEASQASASASASASSSAGADSDDETAGVAQLARNTGVLLLAVAGAVAATL